MDLKTYLDEFMRSGALIVAAVLAVGTQLGKVGITGKAQAAVCIGAGAVLGAAYNIVVMGIPQTIQGWAFFLLTTIIIALMPSGLYETFKYAGKKANDELLQKLRGE